VGRCVGLVILCAGLVGLGMPAVASSTSSPAVKYVIAKPRRLPGAGGRVRLTAGVDGASRCVFSAKPRVRGLPKTVRCGNGKAIAGVRVAANPGLSRTLTFTITAAGEG
jgi:hypothetical protein